MMISYKDIPGWFSFSSVYDRMIAESPEKAEFVEVGAWFGRSSSYMANKIKDSGKDIKLNVVDIWEYPGDHHYKNDKPLFDKTVKDNGGTFYDAFKTFMEKSGASGYYTPMKMTSVEASKKFEDESLDFVWIDANHDYEYVKEDLAHWYRKVKPGGWIGGHDYTPRWKGVIHAVNEFFGSTDMRSQIYQAPGAGSSWLKKKEADESNPSIFKLEVAKWEHKNSPALGAKLSEILSKDKKVYDFGCGTGYYISILEKEGFDVQGFEGTPEIKEIADTDKIKIWDLTNPLSEELPGGTCISLEVAEHIDAQHEETYLRNITKYCDGKLIISWAVEGQKGYRHINCRNADYVLPKLESLGFKFDEETSQLLRRVAGDELGWFKNTIYVFDKR